ncbi:hypothetical protein DFP85_1288 [Halomonas ventosae]|uniref:HNH endonuclease n=1 Tax=Halomonas ventosae TaxID=229007 RepID=A0A4R6ZDN0_9GAMM|nr:hypothetical protein [Halomonas ventosae]TDR50210.1 hypothetical protein DFP85_1288 [Halomonas ventosae]
MNKIAFEGAGKITRAGSRWVIQSLTKIDLDTPCLLWPKARNARGYGIAYSDETGGRVRVHRAAYCLANGVTHEEIAGQQARHLCHNPSCISPMHVELGTAAENAADSIRDGRTGTGFNVPVDAHVGVKVPGLLKQRLDSTGSISRAAREAIMGYLQKPSSVIHVAERYDAQIGIRLPERLVGVLTVEAELQDASVSELIRTALLLAHGDGLNRLDQPTNTSCMLATRARSA